MIPCKLNTFVFGVSDWDLCSDISCDIAEIIGEYDRRITRDIEKEMCIGKFSG